MDYTNIKSIHFVGIKGVGMAPLAVIAKEAGMEVSGCDVADEFITDVPLRNAKIQPLSGFHQNHLSGIDLVIATGAHGGQDNPEVTYAREKHIPVLMQGQAVGEFMRGDIFNRKFRGISIAGCHGKTTTTALVATIFKEATFDPSFIIGTGEISSLGGSGHYGKGIYFIAEADEYATEPHHDKTAKFLWQHPKYLIVTNVEFDHPDLYKNIDEIEEAYLTFTKNIQKEGVLICNGDEIYSKKLLDKFSGNKISFGLNLSNNFVLSAIETKLGKTYFTLVNKRIGFSEEFILQIIGTHNALNAAAAIIAGLQAGVHISDIKGALSRFSGTKRRFEYKGKLQSGAEIYDDYAHHPTEIKATLEALHQFYPDKKIVSIFQPHTYSRTKKLFDDFLYSFFRADQVVITDIYASQRESIDLSVSAELLVAAIQKKQKQVIFVPTIADVVKYIEASQFDNTYCIITMGAGDIYKIDDLLIKGKLL